MGDRSQRNAQRPGLPKTREPQSLQGKKKKKLPVTLSWKSDIEKKAFDSNLNYILK